MSNLKIRESNKKDIVWIEKVFRRQWQDNFIVSLARKHYPKDLLGLIAETNNKKVGLLTYKITKKEIELISINSFCENQGIGSTLIKRLMEIAKKLKVKKIWLVTDNSNLKALGFYQKRGFVLKKIHPNSYVELRKLKPRIPMIGSNGIPLRDEIELEYVLLD